MIGIIQGRLSNAPRKRLQFFPNNWEVEFNYAKKCGFNYIEFFSERKINKNNPIWSKKNSKRYIELCNKNNLKIYSFVDDFIISNSIYQNKNILYVKKLIKCLAFLKIKKLILPLYGKSEYKNQDCKIFIKTFNILNDFAYKNKIQILIESNIEPKIFFDLNKKLKKKLYLVLDTGNRINLKRNIYTDILEFGKFIKHVHIKDKNDKNENVILGSGNVNFIKLSKILKLIKYKGNYSIESTRGADPLVTAKKNLSYIKKKLFKFRNKI